MYLSETVKEGLRQYSGQAIQIDAKEVYQPMNPGDGRIGKFDYLGPAPETRSWVSLKGVRLRTRVKASDDGKAIASITVEDEGYDSVKLFSSELALTLLKKREVRARDWTPSDGPSFALVTRQDLGTCWKSNGVNNGQPYGWTIGKEHALPLEFTIAPKETRTIEVRFELPDGQYDFLCGYGGGVHEDKCVASNLSAFDIENGRVSIVTVKDR
jgi:hypothetical protein